MLARGYWMRWRPGRIAEALGDLPLALEQAAAYINSTKISFAKYLERFEKRKKLWAKEKSPVDYPFTVQTTWELSIEEIQKIAPVGLSILALCSCFAPDNIPEVFLKKSNRFLTQ